MKSLKHTFIYEQYLKKFILNRIPRLWNTLTVMNLSQSIDTIKRQLKSFVSIS